jgi:hypothetical protein
MDANKIIKQKFHIKRRDTLPFTGYANTTRKDISEIFKELGYTHGAEIGVACGRHALEMFQIVPDLKLVLVDPWTAFSRHSDESMEKEFQRCNKRLRQWNTEYMRMTSIEAAMQTKNKSLDFVYIDGMHDFDNVMMDLIYWVPKVRTGGIISGHDYFNNYRFGVVKAVDAYTYAHNVTEWYVTGGVEVRDRHPSYFWVKR